MRGFARDDRADLLGGADRHRALVDDDSVAVHRPADVAGDAQHVLEIGGAVLALRRADGDEDDLRGFDGAGQLGRERQPAFGRVALDELGQPGLVDGHAGPPQHPDFALVLVDADHVVARLGQAGSHHQPDISRSNDRYFHRPPTPLCRVSASLNGATLPSADWMDRGPRNLAGYHPPDCCQHTEPKDLSSFVIPCVRADRARLSSGAARADRRGRVRP